MQFARAAAIPEQSVRGGGRWIGSRVFILLVGMAVLSSCGPPPEARVPPSGQIDDLPPPRLEPTADFGAGVEKDNMARAENLAEADNLRARAEALRIRAAELSATPIDPG